MPDVGDDVRRLKLLLSAWLDLCSVVALLFNSNGAKKQGLTTKEQRHEDFLTAKYTKYAKGELLSFPVQCQAELQPLCLGYFVVQFFSRGSRGSRFALH